MTALRNVKIEAGDQFNSLDWMMCAWIMDKLFESWYNGLPV